MKDNILNKNSNKKFAKSYDEIVTPENILKAWNKFKKGKSGKSDTNEFALKLTDNLLDLYYTLKSKSYIHGDYEIFEIIDIKKRSIHKSSVRDRVVHHLLYDSLYPYFDKKFIYDSYSCRKNKGVHKALERYEYFARKASKNYTNQVYVLKFDVQKCFASIDHNTLKSILGKHIQDKDILSLLFKIIDSHISGPVFNGKVGEDIIQKYGIPLGNLTSQLFINIYLHELDFYCKHVLKLKYYIRYSDDVVILLNREDLKRYNLIIKSKDDSIVNALIDKIGLFCSAKLRLNIHKVETQTIYSGIDFLGWIHFPYYRILRKATRKKMLRNVNEKNAKSYEGLLSWGSGYKLSKALNEMLNPKNYSII
jgi:retron-type reverse transcriptase